MGMARQFRISLQNIEPWNSESILLNISLERRAWGGVLQGVGAALRHSVPWLRQNVIKIELLLRSQLSSLGNSGFGSND